MIRRQPLTRLAAICLFFGASPVFGGFVVTGISAVPLTPGGVSNQARGINDLGLVTGYENNAAGFQRGIVQQGVGPSTSIGLAPYSPPMTSSEGHAVNNNGIVVGVGRYSAPPPGSPTGSVPYDRGIVFDSNTNQYLAVLEPFNSSGGRRAFAQAINDQNRVVGNGSSDAVLTNQNPRQAFWYDVNPGQPMSTYKLDPAVNGLPFLPGGNWSVAYDINDAQSIVGFAQTPDANGTNRNRAVVWEAGVPNASGNPYTTVERIDTRNTDGTSSLARSINDDGTVVGRMTLSSAFGDETAFVYRPGDASITSLGFFGTTRTEAIDINGSGWIAGYAGATEGDSSNNNRAIVWLPDSGGVGGYQPIDLFAFLPGSSISIGGSVGWTKLLEARAINDFGTIVGYGRFIATAGGPEVTRGFVISTVPEPSSLVTGLLGTSC